MKEAGKLIAQNKKARHEYHVLDTLEAGIVLVGSEVKSCRRSSVAMRDSYARIENGELFLVDVHIASYSPASKFNHDPLRKRKLLFHRAEIKKLYGKLREKGLAFIPLRMYFNARGKVKVEMALAKGKKLYDKREAIKRKDRKRDAETQHKYKP